jgi:hypothetical protein
MDRIKRSLGEFFIYVKEFHGGVLNISIGLVIILLLASFISGSAQQNKPEFEMEGALLQEPAAPEASTFTASVVKTTNLATLSPPIPDPSGITYLPSSNSLLIVDGEVEETIGGISHFKGANVWELTLTGSILRTVNISNLSPVGISLSNEPVGTAFNPDNGHYYVVDDEALRIYDLNPGPDGVVFTADDTWTSFVTSKYGNNDPEGIAYNTLDQHIYTADGHGQEVYEYTTAGTLVSHFDVGKYNVADPESVEYNYLSGTLFVMSSDTSGRIIVECTLDGALVRTIDFTASNTHKAAGLAYAPASDGSGAMRFYIIDRGIDNDTDPNAVDGRLIEMTAPSPAALVMTNRVYLPTISR